MRELAASVLIPTHDHGPTLRASVASALRQTVTDIEVLIIGDGVSDGTRDIVRELRTADERVRFFDFPKGPRHGEVYRHQVLGGARGRIVCYLADDDLYLPHHVEEMEALLQQADLAQALVGVVLTDGGLVARTVDLTLPFYRREILADRDGIHLSATAHTLALYRSLAEGWTTTPPGTATDRYMLRKLLRHPGCRCRSSASLTVLAFPASLRQGWTAADRLPELLTWRERVAGEEGLSKLNELVLTQKVRDAAAAQARLLEATANPAALVGDFLRHHLRDVRLARAVCAWYRSRFSRSVTGGVGVPRAR